MNRHEERGARREERPPTREPRASPLAPRACSIASPLAPVSSAAARTLQRQRRWTRIAFFALFVLAPPLDLFRLDLDLNHFVLFGQPWTLGLDAFRRGEIGPLIAAWKLVWRGFVPIALLVGVGLWVAWRWGRVYCGWLCPHFSVVELINALMLRASGKPSLWEKTALPARLPDGRLRRIDPRGWIPVGAAVLGFSALWAVTLLSYLIDPAEVWGNLVRGTPTRNQAIFVGVATLAFAVEFTLARHLFCRYACAVGLFKSHAWIANPRAMVVGYDRMRAAACADCNAACDNACPMRLKPRAIKRKMFACTQCAECISACATVRRDDPRGSLLRWVKDAEALEVSDRDFGYRHSSEVRGTRRE